MRKSTRAAAPIFVVTLYYIAYAAAFQLSLFWFPQLETYLPIGGIDEMLERGMTSFDRVEILSSTIARSCENFFHLRTLGKFPA